jgi:hypothetical protein
MSVTNTQIEILSDTHAILHRTGSDKKYELVGGEADWIIAVYRHQLTHSQILADTFLMGVIGGMKHMTEVHLAKTVEEIGKRY